MSNVQSEGTDDEKLKELLNLFELDCLFECLRSNGVTYRCLKYVSKSDIKDAISNIGLRAEFRQKLFAWRKSEFNIDDEPISVESRLVSWLEKSQSSKSTESGTQIHKSSLLDISTILKSGSKGRSILSYYENHSGLTNTQREQLITIIVEEANCNDITIRTSDYPAIVDQIISIFPTEREAKEFYFIPRIGKKNARGKLYAKYTNSRAKRLKFPSTPNKVADANIELEPEFDVKISTALKAELKRDVSDWEAVTDKWHKTFHLRRKDLSSLDSVEFLSEWPKYSDSRAIDLFRVDFNIIYPGKELMLFSKWDVFKTKIELYYQQNLHNESCKKLLIELQLAENHDSSDFIITTLLPFVLPPTSWYKSGQKEKRKKITILDAQESLVLYLSSVSDYEQKIAEIVEKNFSKNSTVQPFIIVEGFSSYNLKSFFVYFDKNLYKLNSFIESLVTCFKIFHTLNLKYPIASELSWLFIQKFFFEIDTKYDTKSSNLTALLNFMKTET